MSRASIAPGKLVLQLERTALLSLTSPAPQPLDYDPAPDPPECGCEPPPAGSSTVIATREARREAGREVGGGVGAGLCIIAPRPGHTAARPHSNQQDPNQLSVHPQPH